MLHSVYSCGRLQNEVIYYFFHWKLPESALLYTKRGCIYPKIALREPILGYLQAQKLFFIACPARANYFLNFFALAQLAQITFRTFFALAQLAQIILWTFFDLRSLRKSLYEVFLACVSHANYFLNNFRQSDRSDGYFQKFFNQSEYSDGYFLNFFSQSEVSDDEFQIFFDDPRGRTVSFKSFLHLLKLSKKEIFLRIKIHSSIIFVLKNKHLKII